MKMDRTWMTAAALLAMAGTAGAAGVIVNPGFETQPLSTSWTPYASVGLLSASTDQPRSGSYAVLSTNRTQSYAGPAQSVLGKLTPGVNYTVTAWVRLRAPSLRLMLRRWVRTVLSETKSFSAMAALE